MTRITGFRTIITAEIDVATAAGRRIIRELEGKEAVRLNYPAPEGITGKTYTHQEVWKKMENRLNAYYGTDLKLKISV
ncbi:hypothetical protein FACS1894207_0900 [Bacteroidia bacterium]|nr:hypothetical protein FACS1894207_0900 [Bacteroidia bacterium]